MFESYLDTSPGPDLAPGFDADRPGQQTATGRVLRIDGPDVYVGVGLFDGEMREWGPCATVGGVPGVGDTVLVVLDEEGEATALVPAGQEAVDAGGPDSAGGLDGGYPDSISSHFVDGGRP